MRALPVTCRMFPRIVLHDARGTSYHFRTSARPRRRFCSPHRAGDDRRSAGRPRGIGELEGLDARGEWPPLLRPGVLMDVDSYGAWEAGAIRLLTTGDAPAREALAVLDEATRAVTAWTPGSGALHRIGARRAR